MAFSLRSLFAAGRESDEAYRLYGAIVGQARREGFYAQLGVPDTPAGRYAMIALHGFLVMDRLAAEPDAAGISQQLFDVMFADMDRNLRELGVGDLSVGKKVKGMAQYFYAMAADCKRGMKGDGVVLRDALRHNVYGEQAPEPHRLDALSDYFSACVAALAAQEAGEIVEGRPAFAKLSCGEGR